MSKETSALSITQENTLSFFRDNKGEWFSGTDLHDKAFHIKMNTVYSLMRRGLLKSRNCFNVEWSYKEQTNVQ